MLPFVPASCEKWEFHLDEEFLILETKHFSVGIDLCEICSLITGTSFTLDKIFSIFKKGLRENVFTLSY